MGSVTRTLNVTLDGAQITDRFAFTGDEGRVCEVLMSILPVREENRAAVIGERYRVSAEGAKLSLEKAFFNDKRRLEEDWGTDHVTRILLDFEDAAEICIKVERI